MPAWQAQASSLIDTRLACAPPLLSGEPSRAIVAARLSALLSPCRLAEFNGFMTSMQGSRGAAKAIEFKGGAFSATTAMIRDTNAMKLADAMHALLGGMPDFFSGEPA